MWRKSGGVISNLRAALFGVRFGGQPSIRVGFFLPKGLIPNWLPYKLNYIYLKAVHQTIAKIYNVIPYF
jgi:hypothetical protein